MTAGWKNESIPLSAVLYIAWVQIPVWGSVSRSFSLTDHKRVQTENLLMRHRARRGVKDSIGQFLHRPWQLYRALAGYLHHPWQLPWRHEKHMDKLRGNQGIKQKPVPEREPCRQS